MEHNFTFTTFGQTRRTLEKRLRKLKTDYIDMFYHLGVSPTQKIFCYREKNDIVYDVEMPNIEAGIISSSEGAVPPLGREMLCFMGITSAREFASFLTTLVLARELNLSIEIVCDNLYRAE